MDHAQCHDPFKIWWRFEHENKDNPHNFTHKYIMVVDEEHIGFMHELATFGLSYSILFSSSISIKDMYTLCEYSS